MDLTPLLCCYTIYIYSFSSAFGDITSFREKLETRPKFLGEEKGEVFTSKLPFYVYSFRFLMLFLKAENCQILAVLMFPLIYLGKSRELFK